MKAHLVVAHSIRFVAADTATRTPRLLLWGRCSPLVSLLSRQHLLDEKFPCRSFLDRDRQCYVLVPALRKKKGAS